MELPQLEQGLQQTQEEAPWLGIDNLMSNYGTWFDNDQGLGEVLLQQLRARGVDTQAATEAMLRELLSGLVDDLNMLQMKLTGFTSAIAQQMQQTQAVADSVQTALDVKGASPAAMNIQAPSGMEMPQMNDLPPDMGQAMSPEPAPAAEPAPADSEEPPAPAEEPPAPAPAEEPPAPEPQQNTMSDRRMKKFVLSDAMKKDIADGVRRLNNKRNFTNLNQHVISACNRGF